MSMEVWMQDLGRFSTKTQTMFWFSRHSTSLWLRHQCLTNQSHAFVMASWRLWKVFLNSTHSGQSCIMEPTASTRFNNSSKFLKDMETFLYHVECCFRLSVLGASFFVSTTTSHLSTATQTSLSTTWGTGRTKVGTTFTTPNQTWITRRRWLLWRRMRTPTEFLTSAHIIRVRASYISFTENASLVSGTCSSTLGGTTRTIPTERKLLFGKPCLKSFPMVWGKR